MIEIQSLHSCRINIIEIFLYVYSSDFLRQKLSKSFGTTVEQMIVIRNGIYGPVVINEQGRDGTIFT